MAFMRGASGSGYVTEYARRALTAAADVRNHPLEVIGRREVHVL
jgi:hypothetical protein